MFNTQILPLQDVNAYYGYWGKAVSCNAIDGCRPSKINEHTTLTSILPFTKYDHYFANKFEIIVLSPFVTESRESLTLLEQNNFKIKSIKNGIWSSVAYRPTNASNTFLNTHDIIMCVMVCDANESMQIKYFIDHYIEQGIEKIFMYYTQPGSLHSRKDLPQHPCVEYFEWNFPPVFYYKTGFTHHGAQTALYASFYNKIASFCNWSIFCDLDEIIIPSESKFKTIKDYLNTKNEHIFTTHARVVTRAEKYNYENIKYNVTECARGKPIIYGKILNNQKFPHTPCVHKSLTNFVPDPTLLMLHG
jgi:hypothetical protein